MIPIEVKSGSEGRLESLHIFMNNVSHDMTVRFFSGELQISTVVTHENKTYYLLNLPYFLVSKIEDYLKWFEKEIERSIDNTEAMTGLASMYENGKGTEKNIPQAIQYYKQAAGLGDEDAKIKVKELKGKIATWKE